MTEAQSYKIAGQQLCCQHCEHTLFFYQSAASHLSRIEIVDLFRASASIYICAQCGYAHWFFDTGSIAKVNAVEIMEQLECLECGATIPATADVCPSCGWSYAS